MCFGRRVSLRHSGLRLEGLYLALATFALAVAVPQILKYQALRLVRAACRASCSKPERPVRPAAQRRPVALLLRARHRGVLMFVLAPTCSRAHRTRDDGDPGQSIAAQAMGVNTALYKSAHVRRVSGLHRRGRRARRHHLAVRGARQLRRRPVDHVPGRHRDRRPRVDARCASSARCSSSSCRTWPTRSPRPRRGRCSDRLRHPLIVLMYLMPCGIAGACA